MLSRRRDQQLTATSPLDLNALPGVSDFAPRPPVKPLSAHAAEVAANIEALHKEVGQLTQERDQAAQEARVLRAELEREKSAHAHTAVLKEAYQRHSIGTRAKLDQIGQNVLAVLNEPGPEMETHQPTPDQLQQFAAKIEQAAE